MRLTLKTLSIIFDYPGEELRELAENADAFKSVLSGEDPKAADLIIDFLKSLDLSVVEEEYVSVFEMPPKCSIYAHTYLLKGKEDMVGQFLLEVKGHYKVKGLDVPVKREIPTYLPVMLEFLALIYDDDKSEARLFARRYLRPWVGKLSECLSRNKSRWAKPAKALELVVERLSKL